MKQLEPTILCNCEGFTQTVPSSSASCGDECLVLEGATPRDEGWGFCPYCGGRLRIDDREGPDRGDKMEEDR